MKKSWDASAGGIADKLYWLNGTKYEPLDGTAWGAIETGRAKL